MKRLLLGLIAVLSTGLALAQAPSAPQPVANAPSSPSTPQSAANAPKVGEPAPDFTLPYATRDSVARDSLTLSVMARKHHVVLAFYPADWSGGCTREVCSFRDSFASLGAVNADVVGISGDYIYSHHEWAKHHNLPFRLAADHSHAVARRYGSFNEQNGYNRRTVFIVDKQGKIAYADLAYSTRDTVSFGKLQAALKNLK